MIISASYRTDIPAFYGEWFVRRLRAGYCRVRNPYSGQALTVDLSAKAVDGFVFWTKNLTPFLGHMETVHAMGYPFVVQYTINAYPRELEVSVIDAARSVRHVRELAERYSPWTVVWRYDPILFTSLTPAEFHAERFTQLAGALEGWTNEVVISFAHIYKKTLRNLNAAARREGFDWSDPDDARKRALAGELAGIAASRGMHLTVCAQPHYAAPGTGEARCVDAARLTQISGRPVRAKVQGNRPECLCHQSRDIGDYDTCPHGCVYCYAVSEPGLAKRRHRLHDPDSEFLFPLDTAPLHPEPRAC